MKSKIHTGNNRNFVFREIHVMFKVIFNFPYNPDFAGSNTEIGLGFYTVHISDREKKSRPESTGVAESCSKS